MSPAPSLKPSTPQVVVDIDGRDAVRHLGAEGHAWGGERPEENALVVVAIFVLLMSPFALTVNLSLTAKRLYSAAQGRRVSGAPWVIGECSGGYPEGVSQTARKGKLSCRRFVERLRRTGASAVRNPGCAAHAATLGYGV